MEILLMTGVTVLLGGGVGFLTHVVKMERRQQVAPATSKNEQVAYPALRLVK
ncbi:MULTISPECIES: hypothetical protein [Exiguobacterium]|uniref:hypothetical protein n=1 Tax=Exiguobacterium TaxID=33986 RepID=UPI000446DA27|nr:MULTISPECIES: hypothetical protein [unclassified Exiguobacterium]EZP62052.1 hypothetical protein BW42_01725 [Exiguobacterium sp. RIT341]